MCYYSHLFNKRGGDAKVAKSLKRGGWEFLEKTKGQLISKWFLDFTTTHDTSGRLVFVRLEEIDDPKKAFRNQLTFKYSRVRNRRRAGNKRSAWKIC